MLGIFAFSKFISDWFTMGNFPVDSKDSAPTESSVEDVSRRCDYYTVHYERTSSGRITKSQSHPLKIDREIFDDFNCFYERRKCFTDKLPSPVVSDDTERIRLVVMSDSHECHDMFSIPACDLFIHSGDMLLSSRQYTEEVAYCKYKDFSQWLSKQPAKYKLIIGGNHDKYLEEFSADQLNDLFPKTDNILYLCNGTITLFGLSIFASPFSYGMSPNKAFQSHQFAEETSFVMNSVLEAAALQESQLDDQVNDPIDILITHGPTEFYKWLRPSMLYVYGHSHETHGLHRCKSDGNIWNREEVTMLAAPIMDGEFEPTQVPIVLDCIIHS
jgi:predicted phosphohydrolase